MDDRQLVCCPRPISKRSTPLTFAKIMFKRSSSRKKVHKLLFNTVYNEMRFLEYYLTLNHISWLKYLCNSLLIVL